MNGSHASSTRPAVSLSAPVVFFGAAVSPAYRHVFFGLQNLWKNSASSSSVPIPAQDVHQRRPHEVRPKKLNAAENHTARNQSRPYRHRILPTAQHANQPERQNQSSQR